MALSSVLPAGAAAGCPCEPQALSDEARPGGHAMRMVPVAPADVDRVIFGRPAPHVPPRRAHQIFGERHTRLRDQMSPVKNQGRRGTCASFAVVALLEASTPHRFSEQCLAGSAGDDPMSLDIAAARAQALGVHTAESCPYVGLPDGRDVVPADVASLRTLGSFPRGASFTAHQAPRDNSMATVAKVRDLVHAGRPVAVAVYVVGTWWDTPAFVPRFLPKSYLFTTVDGRPVDDDRRLDPTPVEFWPPDPRLRSLATSYYYRNEDNPRVTFGTFLHGLREVERHQSVDEYVAAVRPVHIVSQDELTVACTVRTSADGALPLEYVWRCPAHAIVITGADDQHETFQFKNSWGDKWKQEGYGYMSYHYFWRFNAMDTEGGALTFESGEGWP